MPEPELVDEPTLDPETVLTAEDPVLELPLEETPELAPGLTRGQALVPAPPLDQPVLPDPTPQPENYHVAIWERPVTFACLRCMARGLTHDEVVYHLGAAHGEAAVPTPLAAQYTPPQTPPATGAEALMRLGAVIGTAEAAPTPEESTDDERPGDGPGDEPGDGPRDPG